MRVHFQPGTYDTGFGRLEGRPYCAYLRLVQPGDHTRHYVNSVKPVPIQCVTMCTVGHASAPSFPLRGNWARPANPHKRCIRYELIPDEKAIVGDVVQVECRRPIVYLVDYPAVVSAWLMGGEDAAWHVLKEIATWPKTRGR